VCCKLLSAVLGAAGSCDNMPLTFNWGEENRPEHFEGKPKTPVTLLSGFLGTGKTSLLKHLLENQEGVRIGVVVNDVAAVNIDSQLVKRYEKGLVEVAELQNGCVCCSSADDLFSAVQNVVMRSGAYSFEHIVVELSGVGEPEAVKRNWAIGLECTMPVALRTEVKRVVTVVDASTFGSDWLDTRQAQERNEERRGETASHDEKNTARLENVGQLLAEQVEWADVVVVNKTDVASPEELQTTEAVVRALNGKATTQRAVFGKVSPEAVLPRVPTGLRVAESGKGQGYSWIQTASDITVRLPIGPLVKGRDVEFKLARRKLILGLRGQAAPRAEGTLNADLRNTDDVVWEIEGEGPQRCVTVTLEKRRAALWNDLWELRANNSAALCGHGFSGGKACTDVTHQHKDNVAGDEVTHQGDATSAQQRFGIHSFVFQRRRPFSASRLQKLLKGWPTPQKQLFTLQDLEEEGTSAAVATGTENEAGPRLDSLKPVLRSKGFCWLDSEPLRQHIWSHAGRTLSVQPADWWWAALNEEQLKFKVSYPGVEPAYRAVRQEKWDKTGSTGDRRQELVFIGGPKMQEPVILSLLEACLLSDAELLDFQERTKGLQVPNDDFHVNGLLKSLGASDNEIQEIGKQGDERQEEERLARRRDREETDFLRSLGVGSDLEAQVEDAFEAVD